MEEGPDRPIQVARLPIGIMRFLLDPDFQGFGLVQGDAVSDQRLQDIIQQIMENDPNRYGPPPASKESIEKLKRMDLADFENSIEECNVCLTKLSDTYHEYQ